MGQRIMISRLEHFQSRPTVYGLTITSNDKKTSFAVVFRVLKRETQGWVFLIEQFQRAQDLNPPLPL